MSFLSKLKNKRAHMQLVKKEMKEVRELIAAQVDFFSPTVRPYMRHVCRGQGKMLRPGLVLLSAAATGEIKDDHRRFAAILEMIHMASLVHDDVLDKADTRRDLETANALWGNNLAVLLGDVLFSQALLMGAELKQEGFASRMAIIVRDLCQGEVEQSSRLWDAQMSREDYFRLIRMKTATLFSAAMEGAALIQGLDADGVSRFAEMGTLLGTSYQIYDDCLDISGLDAAAGKTLGTDSEKGKLTLPIFYLLESPDAETSTYVRDCVTNKEALDLNRLRPTFAFAEALRLSIEEGTRRNKAALVMLTELPESDARHALEQLIIRLDEMLRALATD